MDAQYKPIYKQAAALQHKFHDYSHTAAHDPAAHLLRNQIHALTKDLASNKNPHTIENRLKVIDRQLRQVQQVNDHSMFGERSQSRVLNPGQTNMLRKNFQSMRMNMRHQPHY